MEHSIEVMRKTLELMDTCIEGVEYIARKLHEGKMEACLYLLEDIVCGFCKMKDSMDLLNSYFSRHYDDNKEIEVESELDAIITAYKLHHINQAILHAGRLQTRFMVWKGELEGHFRSFILS